MITFSDFNTDTTVLIHSKDLLNPLINIVSHTGHHIDPTDHSEHIECYSTSLNIDADNQVSYIPDYL